ncbi:MAG: hypothetical protein WCF36_03825 [Candidatus Nanopelagicales bacterium]
MTPSVLLAPHQIARNTNPHHPTKESLNAVGFYLILSYLPTYLTAELGVADTPAFFASTVALSVYIVSIFFMGHISDMLGRRRMLVTASILFAVLSVPLFSLLGAGTAL